MPEIIPEKEVSEVSVEAEKAIVSEVITEEKPEITKITVEKEKPGVSQIVIETRVEKPGEAEFTLEAEETVVSEIMTEEKPEITKITVEKEKPGVSEITIETKVEKSEEAEISVLAEETTVSEIVTEEKPEISKITVEKEKPGLSEITIETKVEKPEVDEVTVESEETEVTEIVTEEKPEITEITVEKEKPGVSEITIETKVEKPEEAEITFKSEETVVTEIVTEEKPDITTITTEKEKPDVSEFTIETRIEKPEESEVILEAETTEVSEIIQDKETPEITEIDQDREKPEITELEVETVIKTEEESTDSVRAEKGYMPEIIPEKEVSEVSVEAEKAIVSEVITEEKPEITKITVEKEKPGVSQIVIETRVEKPGEAEFTLEAEETVVSEIMTEEKPEITKITVEKEKPGVSEITIETKVEKSEEAEISVLAEETTVSEIVTEEKPEISKITVEKEKPGLSEITIETKVEKPEVDEVTVESEETEVTEIVTEEKPEITEITVEKEKPGVSEITIETKVEKPEEAEITFKSEETVVTEIVTEEKPDITTITTEKEKPDVSEFTIETRIEKPEESEVILEAETTEVSEIIQDKETPEITEIDQDRDKPKITELEVETVIKTEEESTDSVRAEKGYMPEIIPEKEVPAVEVETEEAGSIESDERDNQRVLIPSDMVDQDKISDTEISPLEVSTLPEMKQEFVTGEDVEAEFRLSETVSDRQDVQAEFRLGETLSEKERLTAEEKEIISDEEKRRSLSVSSEEIEEEITHIEEKPESPVTITVEEKEITKAPEVIQYLQDISAQDGGQAQLVCKVTGIPRPTVTWYKGEEMIFPSEEFKVAYEGDECTLIIADVYPEDAGQYKVVAKNDVGTAMTTCDLSVLAPEETVEEPEWLAPSFIQKPKFQTVDVGQTVMFEAKIVANPGPQIHWTRNDILLSSDKKVQIETKQDDHLYHTTIQLNDVLAEDAGTYKVTAQNDYGEANVSVSLLVKKPSGPEQTDFREKLQTQVKFAEDVTGEEVTEEQTAEQKDFRDILKKVEKPEAPEFVKTIKNQEIPEGDEVKFVTKVKGKPEPTVTWFHDNQTIVSDDIYKVIPGEEGESTLLLPEAFPEDSGKYSVQAENEAGKAECSAVLKVITEDELDAGELEEAPKPEVIKKVEVVQQEAEQLDFRNVLKSQVKFDEDVTGVETTVTIQEAEQVDYRDVLQKKQPEDLVAPEFVVSIGDMKIQEGESTKFTVKAKGQPAPEIQWFVNNVPIKTDDIYQVIPGEVGESTLVLSEAFPEDSGVYTVKAINEAGQTEATALLTVNELIEAESPQPEEEEEKEEVTSFEIKPKEETEAEITIQISEEKEQPKEDIEEEVIIQPETEEEESSERSIPEDVSYEASFEEDNTVSADMSIEEPMTIQPKDIVTERKFAEEHIPEQQEGYVMVSEENIPEKPTEEEFTIITKEEIPSLDLPKTASDDDKDVKPYSGGSTSSFEEEKPILTDRQIKPKTDEDVSISSDEVSEEDIEEDITVSSATSEEEIEEKGYELLKGIILEDISIPEDTKKPSKEFEFVLGEEEKGKRIHGEVEEEIILPEEEQPEFLTKDITEQIDIPEKPTPSDVKFIGKTDEGEITAPEKSLYEEQPVDITGEQISKAWKPDVIEQPTLLSDEKYRGRIQEKEITAPERVVREEEYPVDIEEEDISEERKQDITEEHEDYEADEMIIYEDQEQPENIGFITHTIDYLETVPEEDSYNSSQDASFSVDDQPEGPTGEDIAVEKVIMRAVIQDKDIEESIDISQVTETFTADVSEEVTIPQFLRDLSDQEVTEGDTVTFIVQLAGSPFPEISWYKDGKLIESGDHYKVEVRGYFASLILKDVMPDDDAEYTVKATNEAGTTSSVGQLFVNPIGEAPTFISRIDDKEIEVGAPVVLECQIRGHPKPRVSWLKDGEEIIGDRFISDVTEETARLTILDTIPEDEGEYTIKAINDKGVATSSAEVLIQLEAPKFSDTLKDVSAQYLDTAVLECSVHGKPTPKVTWLANESVIEESAKYHIRQEGDHAVLEIHDVSLEDSDIVYSCRAENAAGEIICSANVETQEISPETRESPEKVPSTEEAVKGEDTAVIVTEGKAPEFLLKIQTETVEQGELADFNVEVLGTPRPEIHWLYNGIEIIPDKRHAIFDENNLSHLQVYDIDEAVRGTYTVEATNDYGTATCSAELVVKTQPEEITQELIAPKFIVEIQTFEATIGETAKFTCKAKGQPKPQILWFKNDKEITKDDNRFSIQYGDEEGEETLLIVDVLPEHDGTYSVEAKNTAGSTKCKAELFVEEVREDKPSAPEFIRVPEKVSARQHDTAQFMVKVIGTPKPKVVWKKDNMILEDKELYQFDKYEDQYCFEVKDSDVVDAGVYTCVATNEEGEVTVDIPLIVNEIDREKRLSESPLVLRHQDTSQAPEFTEIFEAVTVMEDKPLELTCRVTGLPS
ncbi:TTN [Mytilus coruscus]|uniref:TTN n=1 Tax=Mytilus coruscus TaxID=42192 RepID=A0A6J8B505_MYTCO|nr:TTN [Mytilus coruscus]